MPGTLQQRSRVAHHLMQGACLFKGVQAALDLACPGQLEDGAVHGRFEMAQQTGLSAEEYLAAEDGKSDFTFTFLYNCAQAFGVDIIGHMRLAAAKFGY